MKNEIVSSFLFIFLVFSFRRLIDVPLGAADKHEIDGVRKEKERLTAAWCFFWNLFSLLFSIVNQCPAVERISIIWLVIGNVFLCLTVTSQH